MVGPKRHTDDARACDVAHARREQADARRLGGTRHLLSQPLDGMPVSLMFTGQVEDLPVVVGRTQTRKPGKRFRARGDVAKQQDSIDVGAQRDLVGQPGPMLKMEVRKDLKSCHGKKIGTATIKGILMLGKEHGGEACQGAFARLVGGSNDERGGGFWREIGGETGVGTGVFPATRKQTRREVFAKPSRREDGEDLGPSPSWGVASGGRQAIRRDFALEDCGRIGEHRGLVGHRDLHRRRLRDRGDGPLEAQARAWERADGRSKAVAAAHKGERCQRKGQENQKKKKKDVGHRRGSSP